MYLQLLLITALSLSVPTDSGLITGIVSSVRNTTTGIVTGTVNSVGVGVTSVEDGVTGSVTVLKESSVYIASSQCQNVKQLTGINYDKSDEPDMSKLTLDFYAKIGDFKILPPDQNASLLRKIRQENSEGVTKIEKIPCMYGFTDNPSKESFQTLNNAFHAQGNYNISALDASDYINYVYLRATTMVTYIGEALGNALGTLVQDGLNATTIHLIGHSLGSHIASFTGKTLYNVTGFKVGRISGLDPAGPCFSNLNASYRLEKTDAQFVDVIHTDAGVYGLDEIIGHVDYYPNGGSTQTGCTLDSQDSCSHGRAWQFFAESVVNTNGFLAVKCDNWTSFLAGNCANNSQSYMGYGCEAGTAGLYYLRTNSSSPYALGTDGI